MRLSKLVDKGLGSLLEALALAATAATEAPTEAAVHDLRVATRRLSQNLKTFRPLLPRYKTKHIRSRLREMRDLAAAVRSRDILLQQSREARLSPKNRFVVTVQQDRDAAAQTLQQSLHQWQNKQWPLRWQKLLHPRP